MPSGRRSLSPPPRPVRFSAFPPPARQRQPSDMSTTASPPLGMLSSPLIRSIPGTLTPPPRQRQPPYTVSSRSVPAIPTSPPPPASGMSSRSIPVRSRSPSPPTSGKRHGTSPPPAAARRRLRLDEADFSSGLQQFASRAGRLRPDLRSQPALLQRRLQGLTPASPRLSAHKMIVTPWSTNWYAFCRSMRLRMSRGGLNNVS